MKFETSAFATSLLALALAAPGLTQAQTIYMSWPGVPGTALVAALPSLNGTIPLTTYKQSFSSSATAVSQPARYACGVITVTKRTDTTSASFLPPTFSGIAIPSLTFTFTSPGAAAGTLFVPARIVLLNTYMVGVSQTIDTSVATAPVLVDSISMLASTVEATYIPQLANGTAGTPQKFGWNCKTQTPVTF
jgi:hypothetical protein